MKRVICDLCKNIISESTGGGKNGMGHIEFRGDASYEVTVETPGEDRYNAFTFCGKCAERLASAMKRGVLEPDDLPELPEENGNG